MNSQINLILYVYDIIGISLQPTLGKKYISYIYLSINQVYINTDHVTGHKAIAPKTSKGLVSQHHIV